MFGPLALKTGEDESRSRLRAFWANSSQGDRPALHVLADAHDPVDHAWRRTDVSRKECDLQPEWHHARVDDVLDNTRFLAEAMPSADIMIGTDVTDTAVLLGGDYDYLHGEAIVRHDPGVLERRVPAFDPASPFVVALERVYRDMAAHVGRRAFVNTTMTLDALTTLSLMVGHAGLFRAMMSRPELVHECVDSTCTLVNDFYAHFYGVLLELGHGESQGWFHCMAEGRFDVVRSDVSVMLSPEMFEEFVVPELTGRISGLDHALFNMDSTVMVRFLDALSDVPGLDGIFWNPGPAEGSLTEHVPVLRCIRERGLLLDVMAADADEAASVARELGPDGLMISLPRYPDVERAEEAIEVVCRVFR